MKLEKVVLNGFKSFADKTDFKFDTDITAIVGPNGCGKSNVVDAVKWVLGERSAKSLRSDQMADVIFSGSDSRKASGMAEVGLHFTDVTGGEDDKLSVTRRLYRSGESEYLINDKVSRLKDIHERFMDTGLGTRAYSIIEQGQVDKLVTANKIDRRGLFEEAAGISKFKAHKKEAIRKLDRTEQNLLRLADIVGEVQKQLRSIKLQAGKARNYLEYSEKLKELRVNYSLAEFHQIKTSQQNHNTTLAKQQELFSEIVAQVSKNDALLSELTSHIISTENEINKSDNSLVAIKSKIEQHKERIEMLNERIEELKQRKENASEQIRKITEQNKTFETRIKQAQTELVQSDQTYTQKEQQITEITEVLHKVNLESNEIDASLEDEKSGIIDIVRRTAQLHNEIGSLNNHRDSLSGQKDRLNGRVSAAQTELEQLLTEKARYQTRLTEIEKVLNELQTSLDQKRTEMENISLQLTENNDNISTLKEKRSALQSETNVLEDMEKKREGLDKAVKSILNRAATESKLDYIEGIVADIIQAKPEYASAIEAALEGLSDAIIIKSTNRFLEDTETQNQLSSRVKLLCADKIKPLVDNADLSTFENVHGRAVQFVNYESKFAAFIWNLLGKTIIVENISTAIMLSEKFPAQYRFVTIDGKIFENGLMLKVGPMSQASGLISRKSRLTQLRTDLSAISYQIQQAEQKLQQDNQTNRHLSKLCQDLRTSIYEANTEKTEANSKLSSLEQNIERLSHEQPLLKNEIEMLEEQIATSVKKEYESKHQLDELEQVKKQRDAHIETLEAQLDEKKLEADKYNNQLTELKVELGTIAEQRRSKRQEIASLNSQVQHSRITIETARNDLTASDQQIAQSQRTILNSEAAISELFGEKEQTQQTSTELHQKADQLVAQQQQTEQLLREKRSSQAEFEEEIHEVKLKLSQLDVKKTDLCQRVHEELTMDLQAEYENYEHGDIDWDQVREEIADLRGKIDRLGNVNVDAIEQQQSLEERNEFLTKQVDDLNKSKAQLQNLIAKINRESKEKFRVTFEEVRENFQQLFRKLFGGGKADIILEDPEDILECGIEIIAKPPGKELRSISLLSGGEKTMTAIALLFSVFKAKPSPFCILDEVDAALDEANNERFNIIVEEFKKSSQFIIITHSKRTMSIAEVLFGVTMQTQGVSKKISVKFDSEETEAAVA